MRKILIVDDHEVFRDGVRRILNRRLGTAAFGEAGTAPEALELVREQDWDIMVLDLSLGGGDGLEMLKQVKRIRPNLPVLILSMHSEELFAPRALAAGAAGYIGKSCSRAELVRAINKVMNGETYVSLSLTERLVTYLRRGTDNPPHESLSDREFKVLRLIASGKTVGEIAGVLNLSVGTISTYRARILRKMGMKNNAELMRYTIQNGLIE